ncbi:sigma-70 family RNA polymerase sigma factor [Nocardioides sp. 31GB23]|uniref:RNA polymerase sigma factor n=1 Tax=Nocardioides sp. 31GB23 TaxID=3156065 RepID=UPI0032AF49E0
MIVEDDVFAAFVRQHAVRLARLAHQLTHDREAAADLVQDVLLEVYRRWPQVDGARSAYAYTRRMLVNRHIDSGRRRRLITQPWSDDAEATAGSEAQPIDALAERDRIWHALGQLPARQRAVLVLRHYEACPDDEIAALLGCRRATVRSLAARGAATLRPLLVEHTVQEH